MIALALGLVALALLLAFMLTPSGTLTFVTSPIENPAEAARRRLADMERARAASRHTVEVMMTQKSLHRLGYLKGEEHLVVDGHAGPKTKDALNAFGRDVWKKHRANHPPAWRQVR